MRAQGGRALGTDAVSERPLKLYASRWNEGEVSVPECTGRVTNEGRRTTVSASSISTARSRLDGQTKPAGLGGFWEATSSSEAAGKLARGQSATSATTQPESYQSYRCIGS